MSAIIATFFMLIAGCAKGLNDGTKFHPTRYKIVEKYPNFFDRSGRNKYKNGNKVEGEKFWGSSRWFVFLTDSFHLLEMIRFQSCVISVVIFANLHWDQTIAAFIILNISRWSGFKLSYK